MTSTCEDGDNNNPYSDADFITQENTTLPVNIDDDSSDSDCEENALALVKITADKKEELLKGALDEKEKNQQRIADLRKIFSDNNEGVTVEVLAEIKRLNYRQTILSQKLNYVRRGLLPPPNLN